MTLAGLSCKVILSALPQSWHRRLKTLKKYHKKAINSNLQVSFLEKCVEFKVIPKFLQFKLPHHLRSVSSNLQQCQLKALKKSLAQAKKENIKKIEDLRAANLTLNAEERQVLQPILQDFIHTHSKSVSQRHQRKLALLLTKQCDRSKPTNHSIESIAKNFNDSVINLSDVDLTEEERTALSLGFSMSWPMEKFNLLSAKTEAEAIFSKLKSMQAFPSDQEFDLIGKLRSAFKFYFKNKNSNCKKFKPFLKALRLFAKKSGLYVSRFDKGNGVVIDKKENYVDKMMTILNDESKFKAFCHSSRSDKNSFVLYEEKFNRSLLCFRNAGDICI